MCQHQVFSRNPFAILPIELRQAILYELQDTVSLDAAVQADDSLNSAFLDNPSSILDRILRCAIPSELFPEALAVLESARLKPWSKDEVVENLNRYHRHRTLPARWEFADARSLEDMHQHIKYFADDYIRCTLLERPVAGAENVSATSPSASERHRIEGAFYRFELYCNLFRQESSRLDNYFASHEQRGIFFERFSPWENEQLACVHDYLMHKITPAYYDMAAHDVTWGEWRIPMYDSEYLETAQYKSYILSKGLAYLHRLVSTKTFQERSEMLCDIILTYDFLYDAMPECNLQTSDGKVLSEWSEEEKEALKSKSSTADADNGPYEAWYWAHENMSDETFVFYRGHESLRKWGYVMWDYSRLQEWDILSQPFIDPDRATYFRDLPDVLVEEMEQSWDRRGEIWVSGGSGWWSKDDESKIVWSKPSAETVVEGNETAINLKDLRDYLERRYGDKQEG